jgi:hypothetical protein
MERGLQKYISKISEDFLFCLNDKENRDRFVKRLNRIPFSEYEFVDNTTPEHIYRGIGFFIGIHPVNNKMVSLTLNLN